MPNFVGEREECLRLQEVEARLRGDIVKSDKHLGPGRHVVIPDVYFAFAHGWGFVPVNLVTNPGQGPDFIYFYDAGLLDDLEADGLLPPEDQVTTQAERDYFEALLSPGP